jgi:hypothetical protein
MGRNLSRHPGLDYRQCSVGKNGGVLVPKLHVVSSGRINSSSSRLWYVVEREVGTAERFGSLQNPLRTAFVGPVFQFFLEIEL